jgi:hypothetical protein
VLTTDQKGATAEAAIVQAAIEAGLGVGRPVVDQRYDLIFDLGLSLLRIQCKWASRVGDVLVVRCYSARRSSTGLLKRVYSRADVDAFAIYCHDPRSCYLIPFEDVPRGGTMQLRFKETRNNQRERIRWASSYEFAATLDRRQGAIAQLGERLTGSQKVTGSNPVGSISSSGHEARNAAPRPGSTPARGRRGTGQGLCSEIDQRRVARP